MTWKLHINVLDSCNRATGNFYLSAITGLAGGRQLVVTAGLPPIRQICGAWQPPPLTPLSPQPPHPLCEKSERDGIGLPDFPKVLPRIILSCTQKPPTARHPMGMLAVWNWQRYWERRAGCLLLWEGETLSEEVSDGERPGAASSARILGCQQGGGKSAQ